MRRRCFYVIVTFRREGIRVKKRILALALAAFAAGFFLGGCKNAKNADQGAAQEPGAQDVPDSPEKEPAPDSYSGSEEYLGEDYYGCPVSKRLSALRTKKRVRR